MENQNQPAVPPTTGSFEPQHRAKTVFWYLSMFFTLGVSAFALGSIWFQFINKFFPTEVGSYAVSLNSFRQQAIKGGLAALIVASPAFIIFGYLIRRAIDHSEIELKKGPRQWVSYLILFIVVAVAIGDFIASVLALLNGDFTTRFFLKALTILVISGWIFTYFWLSMRSSDALKTSVFPKIALPITAVVIVASIVAGFFLIDSPATSRSKAYDQQRVNDLYLVQNLISNYYSRTETLPATLEEMADLQPIPADPRTDVGYEYNVISDTEYVLCATFEAASDETDESYRYYGPGDFSFHQQGRQCFSLEVNPDPYGLKQPVPFPIEY